MLPLTGFLRCLVLWILEPFSRNVFYENISKFSLQRRPLLRAEHLSKHSRRCHKVEAITHCRLIGDSRVNSPHFLTPSPSRSRIMSSGSFWSDACKNATDRPLQTLLDAVFASHALVVSCFTSAAAALCFA